MAGTPPALGGPVTGDPGSKISGASDLDPTSDTFAGLITIQRRGLVFDKWPFRLDIPVEYQDWILLVMVALMTFVCCLPCICGGMRNRASRNFTSWVYTRLHVFFCVVSYVNLLLLAVTITVLPDWTVDEFVQYLVAFITWVMVHLQKMLTSAAILFAFALLLNFRQRIAIAAGMEHVTVFRWHWKDLLKIASKVRPVEVYVWKVEDLESRGGKIFKPNDVYVEAHLGYNEPVRTRVHNNAGSSCLIRESFQVNVDESDGAALMTLLVKDQSLVTSGELGRLSLSTRELLGIEDQTGKRQEGFTYSEACFVPLALMPRGRIWLRISPVDEEKAPLLGEEDDSLVQC